MYKDFIPDYFHGRPCSVMIHIFVRSKISLNNFGNENIHLNDQQGVLKIKKEKV